MTDEQVIPETPIDAPKPRRTRRSTKKTPAVEAASPTEMAQNAAPPSVNVPEEQPAPAKPRRTQRKTTPKTKAASTKKMAEPDAAADAPTPKSTDNSPALAALKAPSPTAETAFSVDTPAPQAAPVQETVPPHEDAPRAKPQTNKSRPETPRTKSVAPQTAPEELPAQETAAPEAQEVSAEPAADGEEATATPRKRRGRRGGRKSKSKVRNAAQENDEPQAVPTEDEDAEDVDIPAVQANKKADSAKNATAKNTPVSKTKEAAPKAGRRKMFISVVPGEQVEVALVEDGAIHEYYLEMLHQAKTKGNIYKGVIHNIDSNLQAAFVSYGTGKNGFLQIDEVHPEYYLTHHESNKGKKFPPIQKALRAGQEVLVQVVKEPTGNKGAFLTTWLSLAGRFLVLTPGQEQIGVSRKVENDEERARLREMMNGIDPGEGLGAIVRTVSAGTSKTTLKTDLQYLKRVWKDIRKRGTTETAPAQIYQEPGLAERAVRDYLTEDVCEVWVDNADVVESIRETVALLFPRKEDLVKVHADPRQTLWERFNIQRQLEQIYSREVTLPSGGRLVFDQTEALMAIDINSGKISGKGNFEAMALKTNLEAAETIARQLKLRDIGGQIVIDFIEMRDKNHIREVEKVLRTTMKNDRARHDVSRMSAFGLLEVVRQRTGSSALSITMEPCPACGGTGLRRNMEWQSLQSLRDIDRMARSANGKCVYEAGRELGIYLLNHKRDRLRELEKQHDVQIEINIRL